MANLKSKAANKLTGLFRKSVIPKDETKGALAEDAIRKRYTENPVADLEDTKNLADLKTAEELIGSDEALKEWKKLNTLPESQRQANIPEAQKAAEDLYEGNITSREARKRIKEVFPEPELYTAKTMPVMPSVTDTVGAMGKKARRLGIINVKGFDLEPGERVGARLDIPAYNLYNTWVVSIHDGKSLSGKSKGYAQAIRLKNIEFGSKPKEALNIAKGGNKATIARMFGDYIPEDPYELQKLAKKILQEENSEWTQVGMNPYRGSYFYDKVTGMPVTKADEIIQVGPLVLAKNVQGLGQKVQPPLSEMKNLFKSSAARTKDGKVKIFNKGGMTKQMEMFEDGGLSDEGGTIDEASGNDVPVGSLKEEVRDDIPAQLSEGEFVLPADVVRYHGLDKIMRLRDEAKAGLSRMEDMGQMGNSEEAVLPDGMPFNMEDLEMGEDSVSNELEMNVGGLVPQQQQPYGVVQPVAPQVTNTYTVPSAFTNTTQQPAVPFMPIVSPPTPAATTPSFLLPQQTATTQPAQYSFKELMPGTVRREELNAAGQTGTPTVTPSTTTRTSTGGGSGTGSTATDLAGAAATAYTAYKVAPKVIEGAKKLYGAVTGGVTKAVTGAAKEIPGFTKAALDGSAAVKGVVTEKVGELAATKTAEQLGGQVITGAMYDTAAKQAAVKLAASKSAAADAAMKSVLKSKPVPPGNPALSTAAGLAWFALIAGLGAFGMPSGKANVEKIKREQRDKRIKEVIIPFKQMMSGIAGVPYEELLASQQPPKTPWQDMEDDIRASGVGDMDYELDTAKTMFQSNPVFQKQNEEFLAQGDNAKWFNPDMSRTDYMGELYENNPSLKSMAEASKNSFVAGTRLPTGAPNPVLVAQEQYTKHIEAGGEPNTFMPNFEPKEAVEKETATETAGT